MAFPIIYTAVVAAYRKTQQARPTMLESSLPFLQFSFIGANSLFKECRYRTNGVYIGEVFACKFRNVRSAYPCNEEVKSDRLMMGRYILMLLSKCVCL